MQDLHDLPSKFSGWVSAVAEQHDGYGTLRGWCDQKGRVLFVFDEGIAVYKEVGGQLVWESSLYTFENTSPSPYKPDVRQILSDAAVRDEI